MKWSSAKQSLENNDSTEEKVKDQQGKELMWHNSKKTLIKYKLCTYKKKIRTVLGVVNRQIVQGVTQRYTVDRPMEGQE